MTDLINYIINSSIIVGDSSVPSSRMFDGSLETYGDYVERSRKQINYHAINGTDIPAILEASVAGVIGAGVNIQCRTQDSKVNEEFEDFCEEHLMPKNFDVYRDNDRDESLRLIQRFSLQNGGLLIRHRYSTRWNIPYAIELIGVDMIDTSKDNLNQKTLNGLVKNKDRAITGIWVYEDDQKTKSRLISMKDMVYYRRKWMSLSQYTAASKLSVILPMLEQALAYSQAELDAAIERAKAGAYWHTELYDLVADVLKKELESRSSQATTTKEKLKILQDSIGAVASRGIKPQGLTATPKDDTITTIDSKTDSQYSTFTDETQKSMSAAVGSSQVSAYKDPSKSNYAGLQYTGASDEESFRMDFSYMENQFLKDYCARLFEVGVQTGRISVDKKEYFNNPRKYHKFDILRTSKKVTDKDKEAKANAKNLESGATTLDIIYSEKGKDYMTVAKKQIDKKLDIEQYEQEQRKARGLEIQEGEESNEK